MFKNMKIGARLGAGFGVVLLIFAISVIISALFLNVVDTSVKQVKTETIPFLMKSYEIDVDVTKVGEILTDICATHNTEGFKEAEKTFATVKANIASFKEMFTKENDTKSLKEIDELEKALNKFYEDGQKMAQVYVSKGMTEGNKLMPDFDKTREKLLQEVEGFQQGQIDEAKANMLNVEKATTNVSRTLYLLGFLSIVIGIVIALFVTRSIIRPLSEAVDVTHRLAEGDLTVTIDIKSKDETGQLLTAMQNMVRQLTTIIADVKSAAENVSSGSQELSSTAEEMSQGATEQAAAAEEASSSMEEMTSNIRQNADNSQQTEKIAIKSATDAREGGAAVSETVKAMKEIAGKITIIEEIARQTNLLALNAAIEAARAGEHGKGFAVVASEVRKLAERSQTAAAEISKLSASSVEVAAKAGEMLTKIVPDIQKTAELVQEISAASNEQNTGAEQINQAIQQLDQVIQQNASASEEMASTAEELASQSEQLQASIAFFRTGDGDGARVRDRAAAKATHKASVAHITQDAGRKQAGTAAKARTAGVAIEMGSAEHDKRDEEFEKY